MSYGHASKLLDGKPDPNAELRAAVRRLKAWADANPSLMSLYLDFEACLKELDARPHGWAHLNPRKARAVMTGCLLTAGTRPVTGGWNDQS